MNDRTAAIYTKFIHGENFSVILVKPFQKKLDTKIRNGFINMNEALKIRYEK